MCGRSTLPLVLFAAAALGCARSSEAPVNREGRSEVVFWHFWGGRDLPVVEDVVRRFNASQERYRVRAVAMPGANLELKLFLAIAGGAPPDVMNHDDQVVADWAHRGALTPLDEVTSADEVATTRAWLFPSAQRLGAYRGRLYALVNGLDVRALYYNKTALAEAGLKELAERGPRTLAELDQIASTIAPPGGSLERVGYLPDPRRLWAWGVVFGGDFGDASAVSVERLATPDDPRVGAAL